MQQRLSLFQTFAFPDDKQEAESKMNFKCWEDYQLHLQNQGRFRELVDFDLLECTSPDPKRRESRPHHLYVPNM